MKPLNCHLEAPRHTLVRMPCHSCHGRAERPTTAESAHSSASSAGWSSLTVRKLDSSLGELSCSQSRENGRHTR
eukprot:5124269-Prymnesium_polylepis.1